MGEGASLPAAVQSELLPHSEDPRGDEVFAQQTTQVSPAHCKRLCIVVRPLVL